VIPSPRKDRPRRHTACHDTCGDYQAYKARLDAAKRNGCWRTKPKAISTTEYGRSIYGQKNGDTGAGNTAPFF
jgi:hypothetical protein